MAGRHRFVKTYFILFAVGTLLLCGGTARAQVVTDPHVAEFDPSADHNATATDGSPVVWGYRLLVFPAGASQPYATADLGKPFPDPDGKIRVSFLSLLSVPLQPGVTYVARVDAVGGAGSGTSDVSNPFAIPIPCAPTVSPTNAVVPPGGGTVTVGVDVADGCSWTAATSNSWISVSSGATGSGPGTASLNVTPNTGSSGRTATATIAQHTITITQGAGSCGYSIAPSAQSFGATGGNGSFSIDSGIGCTWAATTTAPWISVGSSGSGTGTALFTVAANLTAQPRSASIVSGGQTFTVNQSGAACTFGLSAAAQTVPAALTAGSVSVIAPSGCPWTATSTATWLGITAGASGDGPGYVTFSALANGSNTVRVGALLVAGQTFTISQAGNGCTYTLNPASQLMPAAGGVALFDVSAGAGCAWTAASDASWISIASGAAGSGPGSVTVRLDPNTTTSPRQGSVTAGGQTFVVSEQGSSLAPPRTCSYALSSTATFLAYSDATQSVRINTEDGCSWTASSDVGWIAVRQSGGTGSGTIEYTVAANPLDDIRTGTITVGGQTLTVKQRRAPASKRRH